MRSNKRSIIGNFSAATGNFGYKSVRSVKHTALALKGLVEFNHIGLKKGIPGTVYYSARAIADIYSAVFESAGMLFGRPRTGGAILAASAAIAGTIALNQGYLDNISSVFNFGQRESIVRVPKGTPFFSDKRAINLNLLNKSNYLYNPNLLKKYKASPRIRAYVDLIVAEAKKNGLNPVLFANQLFQESIGFRIDVVEGRTNSNKGAVGIAQFLPSTAKRLYGVNKSDLKNWKKAIPLAAKHMGILRKKYGKDQILAMVAYNAGDETKNIKKNPILFVADKLGKTNITGFEWMTRMKKRRARVNAKTYLAYAWHNETFKYISIITGVSWSSGAIKLAKEWSARIKLTDLAPTTNFAVNYTTIPSYSTYKVA